MKKKFALLLTGLLLLSACGTAGDTLPAPGDNETRSGQEAVDDTEDATRTEAGETTAQTLPTIEIENVSMSRYTEDGETLLVEIIQDNMTLSGEGYEEAAETVRRLLYTSEAELAEQAETMAEMALEHYTEVSAYEDDFYWFTPYTSNSTYEIARMDSKVLSVKRWSYDYSGGAHGYSTEWGTTIDLESGAALELPHLAENAPKFMDKALEVVLEKLSECADELYDDYETYVKESFEKVNWYLDAAGIEVVFTPYEIGPYASGNIIVCIPYGEVADYMKPEYCGLQETHIGILPQDSEVTVQLADGGSCTVLWQCQMVGEYEDKTTFSINGGASLLEEPNIRVQHAYLMQRPDGRSFLIYDIDWASDDYETYVYELGTGEAVQTAEIWAALDSGNIGFDSLNLRFTLYVLGTYTSEMRYALTEDGELVPLGERYEISLSREWPGLTTIKELPVTVDGQQTTLPAGTQIYIEATDNAGTVWFSTADDVTSGEIHYENSEDDYPLYIDGVSEYEYFESLPYAG